MNKRFFAALLGLFVVLSPFSLALAESGDALGYIEEMDKNTIMTFEITVDPEAWQTMLDNASDKEYISADITINGVTIENVGIRPKGNSSLSSIARDDTTDRYSFKIKFDEYVDDQTWLGLDKLVLNSNYSDATSMKEYLSYDIMNYIGVDTSLYAYADISVNGETWGFYLAIEDTEYSYLERTKDGEGQIYKPESNEMGGGGNQRNAEGAAPANPPTAQAGQPSGEQPAMGGNRQMGGGGGMRSDSAVGLIYTDDNEESYASIFDNAKTETKSKDHQRVIEAIKNLNEGTDLETYVDVDQMLRYLAGHNVVVNLDSYSSNMGHNYLLYENDGQISMIPWDYNMAFGGFQSSDATSVVNFPIDTPVSGVSMEGRPMISKLLEVPEYLEQYHAYLQEIIDEYFANGAFAAKVDELDAMISTYIENDPTAFYTYEEYQTAIEALKELGTLRGESVQGQLDGTIPATSEGQSAEPDKLIDASSINMSDLGGAGGNNRGMMNGGFGGDGNMDTMRQAMEILRTAENGELTDEQQTQLADLGLSEEEITQMMQFVQ